MKYKVTIEYAAYFELEIDADDEDQAEELVYKEFEEGLCHPFVKHFYMKHTESEVIEVKEIKD